LSAAPSGGSGAPAAGKAEAKPAAKKEEEKPKEEEVDMDLGGGLFGEEY